MSKTSYIDENLYEYVLSTSLRESQVLTRLRAETQEMPMGCMQVSADQGQFMALLVKLIGAAKIVEIGTFTGYSSTVMALALPHNGRVIACDVNEEYTDVARRYWQEAGVDDRIELRVGPAADTLGQMLEAGEAGTCDMVFIDADKVNYGTYYEQGLQLLRTGGLVLVDNALWQGRTADSEETDEDTVAIRQLNAAIHQDERVDLSLLSVGDGLMLARKR